MRGQEGSGGPLEVAQGRKRKMSWGRDRTSQQSAYHLSNSSGREVGSVSSLMGTGHDCRNLSVLGRHLGCSPLSLESCSCVLGWMWIQWWILLAWSRTQRAFKLWAVSSPLKTPHSLILWILSLSLHFWCSPSQWPGQRLRCCCDLFCGWFWTFIIVSVSLPSDASLKIFPKPISQIAKSKFV